VRELLDGGRQRLAEEAGALAAAENNEIEGLIGRRRSVWHLRSVDHGGADGIAGRDGSRRMRPLFRQEAACNRIDPRREPSRPAIPSAPP
jgi:hypothetical protein